MGQVLYEFVLTKGYLHAQVRNWELLFAPLSPIGSTRDDAYTEYLGNVPSMQNNIFKGNKVPSVQIFSGSTKLKFTICQLSLP